MNSARPHGFSVDVEDWFHILEHAGAPEPARWAEQPSRVELATHKTLDLLDKHQIRATFFCLGWVAQTYPDLIAAIAERGHEIGSHGHHHQLTSYLQRDGFCRDLDLSLSAISRAIGRDVKAFRAPGFSIGAQELWALPILASRGIELDASLFLSRRAHGGMELQRKLPFELQLSDGKTIVEVPTTPRRIAGKDIAWSGGGYLRLWPTMFIDDCLSASQKNDQPAILYIHPREMDPQQPRMKLPWRRRFKYYVGLEGVERKLEFLFSHHKFTTLSQVVALWPRDAPLRIDVPT